MELAPATYRCGAHGIDLTESVREEVSSEVPVAYRASRPRLFVVVITCPGDGSPHDLRFAGQVTDETQAG
jgi:hypothetical protein